MHQLFQRSPIIFFCSAGALAFGRARGGRDGPWNAVSNRLFLRNDCPEENRIARISRAPPRQNLLDLFAI